MVQFAGAVLVCKLRYRMSTYGHRGSSVYVVLYKVIANILEPLRSGPHGTEAATGLEKVYSSSSVSNSVI